MMMSPLPAGSKVRLSSGRFQKRSVVERCANARKVKDDRLNERDGDAQSRGFEVESIDDREVPLRTDDKGQSNAVVDQEASSQALSQCKTVEFPVCGRRVVDVALLSRSLAACANPCCDEPLQLIDADNERRCGLASVLNIPCRACGYENKVETDKRHRPTGQQRGPAPFTVNEKAALGE